MKFDCIIFDCDGVLVDSEFLSAKAWTEILQENHCEIDAAQVFEDLQGGNIHTSLDYIQRKCDYGDRAVLELDYRSRVSKMFEEELQPIDGILEFLKNSNILRCIASNSPMTKITRNLEITRLTPFFENSLIFSGHHLNMFKPAPDLFLYSASKMNIPKERCIIIEDSLNGLIAAEKAGIEAIFYNPHNTHYDGICLAAFSEIIDIYHFIHN